MRKTKIRLNPDKRFMTTLAGVTTVFGVAVGVLAGIDYIAPEDGKNLILPNDYDVIAAQDFLEQEEGGVRYEVTGANSLHVEEAGVEYNINFLTETLVINSAGEERILSFPELGQPAVVENFRQAACRIAEDAHTQAAEMLENDTSQQAADMAREKQNIALSFIGRSCRPL